MNKILLNNLPNRTKKEPIDTHFLNGMQVSRYHLFCQYNKYGNLSWADDAIDKHFKNNDIEDKQSLGLSAELQFYYQFKDKAGLIPTLDCGDNTDFIGILKGHLIRFDVTTNLSLKKQYWDRYLRFKNHVIVVWNKEENSWSFWVARKDKNGEFRKVR